MFTTIMYGFINEVTRQRATSDIPLTAKRYARPGRSVKPLAAKNRPVATASGCRRSLPGKYRVLADSFKRAAGFY